MKGKGAETRVSYEKKGKLEVPKSCFRVKESSSAFAMIEAAVDSSTCGEMTGGEIGEALTTTTTTTTEEVPPEPEIDEEAEKAKTVDALSLFAAEGCSFSIRCYL